MDDKNGASDANGSQKTAADTAEQHASNAANRLDAKLSGPLAPLEESLDDIFGSKAQYQLPVNIKNFLVTIAPWLALISGFLGVLSAYGMWQAVSRHNRVVDSVNQMYDQFGLTSVQVAPGFTLMFWLTISMTLIFAVLALLAFPGLKAKKKVGWNLMFYSLLANILYGVVSLFYGGGGFGSLLGAAISSAIGLYILFQIRSHYLPVKK